MAATHSLSLTAASSQYASIATAANLELTGNRTFEAWVRLTSYGTDRTILGKSNAAGSTLVRLHLESSSQKATFQISNLTSGNKIVTSASTIATGVWVHVAATYDGSNLNMYINGELEAQTAATGTSTDPGGKFGVGVLGDFTSGNYYNGHIRNARVWNVARTQQQIRDNMNVDTPVGTGLQGNWILNNAYTDLSGNGYTLTPSGSPTFSTTYPDAIDLVENKTFTKKHKITVQHTQVAGSANLTDVPIVFTESNFLADVFSSTYNGSEINSTRFLTDANIKAYYRMESGALTTDSSGNGYTLTNNNTVADGTGKYGGAADGGSSNTNKSLSTTNLMGFGVNDARTLSCWIKMNTEHSGADKYQYIFSSSHALEDRSYDIGYFRISSVNYIYIFHNRAGGVSDSTIKAINLGTSDWYHLALTFDGTTLKGFINGEKIGSVAVTKTNGPVNSFTDGLHILRGPDLGGNISALIDDAVIFNRALTEGEIAVITGKGRDLRFSTDIDGKTRLAHEIVSFDKGTSKAEVWVKANTLDYDDNTDIYVHYGNSTASALDENEAFGKHQVWGENWEGVWHLNETSGTRVDATKNSYDLTDNNTVLSGTGKLGTAADFEFTNSEYLNAATSFPSLTSSWYIGAWVKRETTGATHAFYSRMKTISTERQLYIYISSSNKVVVDIPYIKSILTSTGTVDTNYHFIAVVKSGTTWSIYIDGSLDSSVVDAQAQEAATTTSPLIGKFLTDYMDGLMDEFMIYNNTLSADYITTLYNNQNSPSTFATPSSLAGGSFLFNFV